VSEKLAAKFPASTLSHSMVKRCSLRIFLTGSKPSKRSITIVKRSQKEKKGKVKKINKVQKGKDIGHFLTQIPKFDF